VTNGHRRRPAFWSVAAYVVLLALVIATVVVGLRLRSDAHHDDARDEALATARQQAVNLVSIDYRTAEADLQRIVDGSTGEQATAYKKELTAFPPILRQSKSVSTGEVVAAGVESYDNDHAVVALAVNQTATSTATKGDVSSSRRMVLDLERVDGRWLVSKQTFVGNGVIVEPP
jgi:Mce-associated membrane protein